MIFDISKFQVDNSKIPFINGFSEDLYGTLVNLGLENQHTRIVDIEFVSNMGTLLTGISFLITNGVEKEVDWKFNQYGVLHTTTVKQFDIVDRLRNKYNVNYLEFGYIVGIIACQENMVWAIKNGIKNAFRMSYFYSNFLSECVISMPDSVVNKKIVSEVVLNCESDDFVKYKNILADLLLIPVSS